MLDEGSRMRGIHYLMNRMDQGPRTAKTREGILRKTQGGRGGACDEKSSLIQACETNAMLSCAYNFTSFELHHEARNKS